MSKTLKQTALWAALAITTGLGISACGGGEHEEVKAVDMVDEAAELARKNAPEAEDMGFEETSATAVADNATAADEAGATESEAMSTEQEMMDDTAEASADDSAAAPAADAEASADSDAAATEETPAADTPAQ
ncbi:MULTISPECIES: hypothetical protein [unclassified Psychrobacter]|uniref:hypothetical protein n=1 Tax=unclassified Psychrobacter TaxID=196806 RepID=UPI0018F67B59|nr:MULTISPECIES: hypothetical protein [unclassified Psychrobacter]